MGRGCLELLRRSSSIALIVYALLQTVESVKDIVCWLTSLHVVCVEEASIAWWLLMQLHGLWRRKALRLGCFLAALLHAPAKEEILVVRQQALPFILLKHWSLFYWLRLLRLRRHPDPAGVRLTVGSTQVLRWLLPI